MQPHFLGLPPPPHVSGAVHEPQLITLLQPSGCVPHSAPMSAQVSGSQGMSLHWFSCPPPQIFPVGQSPQSINPSHPSEASPHSAPRASHVEGLQPHWLGTPPPPHVSGAMHSPQDSTFPHPSDTMPHAALSWVHVFGVQSPTPHRLSPSPPQFCPGGQVPQFTVPPQPSGTVPHSALSCTQDLGAQAGASSVGPSAAPSPPPSNDGAGGRAYPSGSELQPGVNPPARPAIATIEANDQCESERAPEPNAIGRVYEIDGAGPVRGGHGLSRGLGGGRRRSASARWTKVADGSMPLGA